MQQQQMEEYELIKAVFVIPTIYLRDENNIEEKDKNKIIGENINVYT